MSEHTEFVELCSFYISGSISEEQLNRLDAHLERCADCRQALEEFQQIASMGLPSLAPDFAALNAFPGANHATEGCDDRAASRMLARIENEIACRQTPSPAAAMLENSKPGSFVVRYGRALLPYAAAAVLAVSASLYTYHLGSARISNISEPQLHQVQARVDSLEASVAELSGERDALTTRLQAQDRTIEVLTANVKVRLDEIAFLKTQEKRLADNVARSEAGRVASDAEKTALAHKLADTQTSVDAMQKALEAVRNEHAADLLQTASLEKRMKEAADALKERDQTIEQQRNLLAYDRDIRDLIGARDLYVAEVNDVDRNARTQTPFGRVFYTKGKSLIFYAYDLDQQPGLRRASTFQAWGRRGADFEQALPLGILYLDSSAHKRWVLKFDDPKALAKIDAVFVTVEPKGGSQKPSGKPLLFAYLKVEPNHP